MNLIGTLAKVAMGVMVSRGIGKMMGRGGASGGGGLGGLIGSVLSGGGRSSGQGGGLGGLLDSLGGGGQAAPTGGLGNLLNQSLDGKQPTAIPQGENDQAELLLRSMINAAKCDGEIDAAEQQKIVEQIGEVGPEEVAFVQAEMAKPLDLQGFIRTVPKDLGQPVYLMSLLGIDLDSKAEAQYLDQLREGLGISTALADQIHDKVGAPKLYS